MVKYAFFDLDRHDTLKNNDIGPDLPETHTRKSKPTFEKYETEVDCSGVHVNDNEYIEHMRTLNKKQYELCSKLLISVTEHLVEVVDKLSTTAVVFFRSERILKCKCLYGA